MAKSQWATFKTLFNIFCCPPIPSRITNKLAFVPPDPTYVLLDHPDGQGKIFRPLESAEWQFGSSELENIEAFSCTTKNKESIYVLSLIRKNSYKYTIMFSHGNAVDLGQMSSFLTYLANELKCNIFCYDYSGYGASSGRPSESNLYADAEAAFECLLQRAMLKPEEVILYGQSIGTVPTIDLATKVKCAGVILHCPLMSGMRIAFPKTKDTWFFDSFPSIDKAKNIESPVLVIHGTDDEVINICHGQNIFKQCPKTVDPLWVPGAGHNDIEMYPIYIERLHKFIEQDLPYS
ncbi:hypothetical protein HELRODRAFT_90190 [Helobdella robusta]|uniref:Serine aminopeptidase S33 domain-containing protein n=1 Tax=Helobdella robusta TaxID=6412 RepID=T1G7M1_HELRO|nr:hypothetical protein HELRODRAFT_90190 [Helobdella robusta]ESN91989.1 hypothetical protein HELRODRAFT_90190 [Helobdella robusta]